jgi:hypothetical protein
MGPASRWRIFPTADGHLQVVAMVQHFCVESATTETIALQTGAKSGKHQTSYNG